MRRRTLRVIVPLVASAGRRFGRSPDHQQSDSGADRETRPGGRDHGSRAPAGHPRDSSRRSGRVAGRLGSGQLRAGSSRRPPLRQRLARFPVPDRLEQSDPRVCECRRGVSECGLQPAGERIHRVCLSSGVRAKWPVLHGARGAWAGQSEDARLHPARVRVEGRDLPQHHHGVARDESGRQRLCGHQTRAPARGPRGRQPDASHGRGGVQPDVEARRCGLRPALHQRQRSRIQQWRRTEREQSASDPASRFAHDRHPAHRSTQSVGHARREGTRRLHDSDGQQVRRRRRPEHTGRNLRLRFPERPPALVGHRRNHVRLRHRHGPHRGDQYRPQRRELWLDEARRVLGKRPVARRRAERTVPAACGNPRRAPEGRLHLSRRDLRPRRRAGGERRLRVSRPDCGAPRQVRLWRHSARPRLRGRPRRDEEGRRWDSQHRGSDRRSAAVRAGRERQPDGCVAAGAHRSARWAPASPAPISTSAGPATANCSSRRGRMGSSGCSFQIRRPRERRTGPDPNPIVMPSHSDRDADRLRQRSRWTDLFNQQGRDDANRPDAVSNVRRGGFRGVAVGASPRPRPARRRARPSDSVCSRAPSTSTSTRIPTTCRARSMASRPQVRPVPGGCAASS